MYISPEGGRQGGCWSIYLPQTEGPENSLEQVHATMTVGKMHSVNCLI